MDSLDEMLLRASELFLEDVDDSVDDELAKLLPALIESGYIADEPWGEDSGWSLWRFTAAGTARMKLLEVESASQADSKAPTGIEPV